MSRAGYNLPNATAKECFAHDTTVMAAGDLDYGVQDVEEEFAIVPGTGGNAIYVYALRGKARVRVSARLCPTEPPSIPTSKGLRTFRWAGRVSRCGTSSQYTGTSSPRKARSRIGTRVTVTRN